MADGRWQIPVRASTDVGRWDVHPDNQRILMARPRLFEIGTDDVKPELILVQNFFEELKTRMPR